MRKLQLLKVQLPYMKTLSLSLAVLLVCSVACNKSTPPSAETTSPPKTPDAVQIKLQEYAGSSATNCGRLDVKSNDAAAKAASDCAMQANQNKKPFYVAYDMPGMVVGVAENSDGKLFTISAQGGTVNSGDCPSPLRVAASGRVTCFAPGDMGSMGAGHTAIPSGMPNPHALPK